MTQPRVLPCITVTTGVLAYIPRSILLFPVFSTSVLPWTRSIVDKLKQFTSIHLVICYYATVGLPNAVSFLPLPPWYEGCPFIEAFPQISEGLPTCVLMILTLVPDFTESLSYGRKSFLLPGFSVHSNCSLFEKTILERRLS